MRHVSKCMCDTYVMRNIGISTAVLRNWRKRLHWFASQSMHVLKDFVHPELTVLGYSGHGIL